MNPVLHLTGADWLTLFAHFLSLSLLSVGGAITTAPDMHRFLVDRQHWLSDPQFSASIAIAQAAPRSLTSTWCSCGSPCAVPASWAKARPRSTSSRTSPRQIAKPAISGTSPQ